LTAKARCATSPFLRALTGSQSATPRWENLADATRTGEAGNLPHTWKANDKKGGFDYLAIAKGKDQRYLNRYAVKQLGVANDDDERD